MTPEDGVAALHVDVIAVDDRGVVFRADADEVVDVRFDDRRIWSFWLLRDSEPLTVGGRDARLARWPAQLRRFLKGSARLRVVAHVSETTLYDAPVRLGGSDAPLAIVDSAGLPLGVDKSGRVAHTFDTRSAEQVAPLLDAIETVIRVIGEAGVEAFPAYGTLLGAVREGALIGHDSDADLGYVSRHTTPVDVIRESFALQRHLEEEGFETHRYSGGAFKVDVRESDGSVRGLDVFGGFLTGGRLYLMGEVDTPFEQSWIFPLGTTTLEGRTLPAPAAPERFLEAMYGPGWRVPDPAFKFGTSPETIRKLNGWFRGNRVHQHDWSRRYSRLDDKTPDLRPTGLARLVVEQEGVPAQLVDVGAGRGSDALWFARQGSDVLALDFVTRATVPVQRLARAEGLDLAVRWFNLNETRSWLSEGTRLAHRPGPRTLVGRHLVDSLNVRARGFLWRFAQMALREGGSLYLDFLRADGAGAPRTPDFLTPLAIQTVTRELEDRGAVIVSVAELLEDPPRESRRNKPPRPIGRVVARWESPREASTDTPGG